jgi:hypothetical protein
MPLTVKQADMTFEDDDEIDDQQTESSQADSSKGSVSRVSARAKKTKAIFDPSDNNGPVHKRKKEALEAERAGKSAAPKVSAKTTAIEVVLPKSPISSPEKAVAAPSTSTPIKKPKTPVKSQPVNRTASIPNINIKKRPPPKKTTEAQKPMIKPEEITTTSIAVVVKEPSKRIQARKNSVRPIDSEYVFPEVKKTRRNSVSTTGGRSDEYEKASTIELKVTQVPDVRKWSHQRVFEYFTNTLGFSSRDSAIFKDEEIDGEALMIMKRSDMATTKFQKLKLGPALKMWSHIVMFQTGSNDPTQAWK